MIDETIRLRDMEIEGLYREIQELKEYIRELESKLTGLQHRRCA